MTGQWQATRVLLCGWVLWSGVAAVEKSTSDVGKPDWSIVTAFDDKKDCDSRLRERIAALAERASKKMGYSTAALGDGVYCRSPDRKSTRLNSSHVAISYAVFCLKKKKATG